MDDRVCQLKGFFVNRGYSENPVLNYHPALLNVHSGLKELQVIINMSANVLKVILPEASLLSLRRPKI